MNEMTFVTLIGGVVAVMCILSVGFVIVIIIKTARGSGSKANRQTDAEETEMIQEMYHGFRKMEKRIESLETLLLDDESARRASFDNELRRE